MEQGWNERRRVTAMHTSRRLRRVLLDARLLFNESDCPREAKG